ncbi:MAG: exodeoxyribonuclease V subunit gamma [Solirubrobacterales bacterium]|nr:exodeoxyribonuclease V subunit gamma [Solirubrobacterales bacterium]
MLHVHRAARADTLADALGALLGTPARDPFCPEVVAVPTRGMERWLTQRMSAVLGAGDGRADGVCANVLFPSPHRLLGDAVAVASGIDPAADPWLPERSVWPLLDVVSETLGEPWLAALARYLGADGDDGDDPVRGSRRLSTLRHLAGLFDRYALHRPAMLEAWREGRDVDDLGESLPAAVAWQAELWRRLRARIGMAGPAERRERAQARLRAEPELLAIGERLALFGLTRLPTGHVRMLDGLAHARDVHLFLLHPSPALWRSVAEVAGAGTARGAAETGRRAAETGRGAAQTGRRAAQTGRRAAETRRRAADPSARLAHGRLLASWGRDAREMQAVLASADPVDHPHEDPPGPPTLLGRLQADVRANRACPGSPLPGRPDARAPLADDDCSVELHSCHGRPRQVEVLRDAILHALARDRTLEPRDVIVMCPDVETFAPLVQATFGAGERSGEDELAAAQDGRIDLRVRLADRSLRQTNPVLGVIAQLLALVGSRLTASEVLDLADRGPVRRRFGLDDDDLVRLQEWIAQAGIRWGLDAPHRAPYQLERIDSGTWRMGLDRLLLGVAMTEDEQRLFAGVLPLDDVDSRAIDLAGRFAELVARLGDALDALGVAQTLPQWAAAIARAADALTATGPRESWQRAELQRVLDELIEEAGAGERSTDPKVAPEEVRAYLGDRLAGRPTRANFRTGHLTVCTLVPMRSVPHRVVCLLGLDDGAFPRRAPRDGDDLMLGDPRIGERDPRSEDRQLLLDALMAATERLIVTYTGNDERTNAPRPPAVPIGELLDTVDATVRCDDGLARERIIVRHPLQPFDPRNFAPGELIAGAAWSFDRFNLQGARALIGPRAASRPFLARALPWRPGPVIEVSDLVAFADHPVRFFLRRRLGVSLRGGADEIEDRLTVELDPLGRWGVGQRLLEALLRGVDGRTASLAEIARGTLPPGVLGYPVINELFVTVEEIARDVARVTGERSAPEPVDVRVAIDDDRLLNGTIAVHGDLLLTTTFSRIAAKQRLASWVRLLALTAARPERAFSAVAIGRGRGGDVCRATIPPLGADAAQRRATATAQLRTLVDLHDRGLREPLPIYTRTCAEYARAAAAGQDPADAARREWKSGFRFEREDRDPEHRLVLSGVRDLDELLEIAPAPDEAGDGWAPEEASRLGRCARRLWDELLAREEIRTW